MSHHRCVPAPRGAEIHWVFDSANMDVRRVQCERSPLSQKRGAATLTEPLATLARGGKGTAVFETGARCDLLRERHVDPPPTELDSEDVGGDVNRTKGASAHFVHMHR